MEKSPPEGLSPPTAPPAVAFRGSAQRRDTIAAANLLPGGGNVPISAPRRARSPQMPRPVRPGSGGAPAQRGALAQKGFGSAPRFSNNPSASGGGFIGSGGGGTSTGPLRRAGAQPGLRPQTATRLRLLLLSPSAAAQLEGGSAIHTSKSLAALPHGPAPRIRPPATASALRHVHFDCGIRSTDDPALTLILPGTSTKPASKLRPEASATVSTIVGEGGEVERRLNKAVQTDASMSPCTAFGLLHSALQCSPSREAGRSSPELQVCNFCSSLPHTSLLSL